MWWDVVVWPWGMSPSPSGIVLLWGACHFQWKRLLWLVSGTLSVASRKGYKPWPQTGSRTRIVWKKTCVCVSFQLKQSLNYSKHYPKCNFVKSNKAFKTCLCVCASGADRHQRGHEAADPARRGLPHARRRHGRPASLQEQGAQLRAARTYTGLHKRNMDNLPSLNGHRFN